MTDSLDTAFVSTCATCKGTRRVPKGKGGILVSATPDDLCPACGLYVVPELIVGYWGPQDFATSIAGARAHPRCWVFIAADYGSIPLLSVPACEVMCDDRALTHLALDLDRAEWSGPKEQWDVHICFSIVPADLSSDTTHPITNELWLNDLLTEQSLAEPVRSVLAGDRASINEP